MLDATSFGDLFNEYIIVCTIAVSTFLLIRFAYLHVHWDPSLPLYLRADDYCVLDYNGHPRRSTGHLGNLSLNANGQIGSEFGTILCTMKRRVALLGR